MSGVEEVSYDGIKIPNAIHIYNCVQYIEWLNELKELGMLGSVYIHRECLNRYKNDYEILDYYNRPWIAYNPQYAIWFVRRLFDIYGTEVHVSTIGELSKIFSHYGFETDGIVISQLLGCLIMNGIIDTRECNILLTDKDTLYGTKEFRGFDIFLEHEMIPRIVEKVPVDLVPVLDELDDNFLDFMTIYGSQFRPFDRNYPVISHLRKGEKVVVRFCNYFIFRDGSHLLCLPNIGEVADFDYKHGYVYIYYDEVDAFIPIEFWKIEGKIYG